MSSDARKPIRRALVSVYDKTGLEELAKGLAAAGVRIVSTGSTAQRIADAGVAVTRVEELTGFPEALDGRVKTLHPMVHAGLLGDTRNPSHVEQLAAMKVEPFDLLVSNLYPFTDTVASGATPDECIEQIDIGGPSMVRGAAKNHANVAVIVDPGRYAEVLDAVAAGGFTLAERQRFAAEAFQHTASYDVAVASWLGNVVADTSEGSGFPNWTGATWERAAVLRYGENPHQPAALYRPRTALARRAGSPRNSCTARRCRTTTTSTRTPPGGLPSTSTSPPWRSSSTPTRVALPSATTSPTHIARHMPATRCRRTAA